MFSRVVFWCLLLASGRSAEMTAPAGYIVRDLGPFGGQGIAPKDWFVSQGTHGTSFLFTASKEDHTTGGNYHTGWRIQWVASVSTITKHTAAENIRYNIAQRKTREVVIRECEPGTVGEFHKQCLETIGAPIANKPNAKYHMICSFFWSDEKDMMIVSTFGAPMEEWAEASKIYQVIKDFKLVDWDRLDQAKRKALLEKNPVHP